MRKKLTIYRKKNVRIIKVNISKEGIKDKYKVSNKSKYLYSICAAIVKKLNNISISSKQNNILDNLIKNKIENRLLNLFDYRFTVIFSLLLYLNINLNSKKNINIYNLLNLYNCNLNLYNIENKNILNFFIKNNCNLLKKKYTNYNINNKNNYVHYLNKIKFKNKKLIDKFNFIFNNLKLLNIKLNLKIYNINELFKKTIFSIKKSIKKNKILIKKYKIKKYKIKKLNNIVDIIKNGNKNNLNITVKLCLYILYKMRKYKYNNLLNMINNMNEPIKNVLLRNRLKLKKIILNHKKLQNNLIYNNKLDYFNTLYNILRKKLYFYIKYRNLLLENNLDDSDNLNNFKFTYNILRFNNIIPIKLLKNKNNNLLNFSHKLLVHSELINFIKLINYNKRKYLNIKYSFFRYFNSYFQQYNIDKDFLIKYTEKNLTMRNNYFYNKYNIFVKKKSIKYRYNYNYLLKYKYLYFNNKKFYKNRYIHIYLDKTMHKVIMKCKSSLYNQRLLIPNLINFHSNWYYKSLYYLYGNIINNNNVSYKYIYFNKI